MKYIIQSCYYGDTKWNFRAETNDYIKSILAYDKTVKQDRKLKANNTYRIINQSGKVLIMLDPENKKV